MRAFGLSEIPDYKPRYNIAPHSQVLIVRANGAALVRWGLIPRWIKEPSKTLKLHNARAETVALKPSFRDAYRKRRCLVPANGFFEWKAESGRKQPYYIYPPGKDLFAFAGLWEVWSGPQGQVESCTIITTDANARMRMVEDRMPAILAPEDYSSWLAGAERGQELLRPCPDSEIEIRKVSRAVNDARMDSAELIEPDDR